MPLHVYGAGSQAGRLVDILLSMAYYINSIISTTIEHAAPDVSSTVAAVVVVVVIITTVTGAFIAVVAMFYRHKHNSKNLLK